jgi:toxin-antitoxin system PIN domain toxin
VYLLDTSVWLAYLFDAHPNHTAAATAVAQATPQQPAFFCRATQQSFLRLASTPALHRMYRVPGMTNEIALRLFDQLLAKASVAYREEPPGLESLWHRLARRPTASPKLWMDAYLAAFAITAGLALISLDRDFAQYERDGLKLQLL